MPLTTFYKMDTRKATVNYVLEGWNYNLREMKVDYSGTMRPCNRLAANNRQP